MSSLKIRWEVMPAPTGRYRSFQERGWPHAYSGTWPIAFIICSDSYHFRDVKTGKHAPLKVRVAAFYKMDNGVVSFKWMTVKHEFKTLAEVKEKLPNILEKNKVMLNHELVKHQLKYT